MTIKEIHSGGGVTNLLKVIIIFLFIVVSYGNEKINIQLNWKYQFEFAGFIMAKEKGFYKEEGLDVTIKELFKNTNVIKEVLSNLNTYGIGDSALIYHILNKQKLELLMPIYEDSPFVLTAVNYKNITSLKDIIQHKFILDQFALKNPSILSMLKSQNIDINKLNVKQENFYDDIHQKGVFAFYLSNEIYDLNVNKIPYKIFNPKDYGINFYGDILFTSKQNYYQNPNQLDKVKRATIKGYKYAFNHIDETINVILKKYNSSNLTYDKLKYEAKILKKFLSKNFKFNRYKLQNIENAFLILGMVKSIIDIDEYIYSKLKLTPKEKQFLKSHTFNIVSTSTWEPFNLLKDNKLAGIAFDYWHYIVSKLDLKCNYVINNNWSEVLNMIKTKQADITLSTSITPEREKYAVFSKPYATFPIVIATRNDVGFIENLGVLDDKIIAVGKNYTAEKLLKKLYPKLRFLEVKNTDQALKFVNEGKVFAAADILPTIAYKINKYEYSNLKISGKTDGVFEVRIMVRKDYKELIPIIDRIILSIPKEKKDKIYRKWIAVQYQTGFSKKYVKNIILILFGLVIVFIIWVIIMKKEILKRDKFEEELEKLAVLDSLTSIYNRYKIDVELENQLRLGKRYNRPFSVIFFDIDHFKVINDTYGHKVGDEVLQKLACLVKENIRESDIFGRWGGEEFLIISPETKLNDAVKLAEKLRLYIETYRFFDEIDCKVTCSFGVTEYQKNDNYKSIINRVDDLLYQAKNTGRNRVKF